MIKKLIIGLILSALVMAPLMGTAAANVPGVALNAPPPPPAPNVPVMGGQGLFKVVVSHRDTVIPATHYIDSIHLLDGNNLIKEWDYDEKTANTNEVFTESIMLPMTKDMNLKAVAHCTLHGYNLNGVYVTVLPAGTKPADMVSMNANIAGMQWNGMDPDTVANSASQMVQQDVALMKKFESADMSINRQHQMQAARYFQSPEGQKLLDAFDYTKKMGGAAARQPGMQQGMAAPDQMQAQQMPAQPMQAQQAAGMMNAPPSQGIPQTVWTDSMGNPLNGNDAKQLGSAAAMPAGTAAGQPQMQQGQPAAMKKPAATVTLAPKPMK